MTFRETFYNVKQLMVNRLIDFGLQDADIEMGWTTLLTLQQDTRITINVPLNLTYSDDFSITGTLETATYRRLANKTLKLKVGNTVVDTTETDINGAYSFTTSPVSMGNHSFQVIFEGTNIHHASESSIINRTINKETSVINVETVPTGHINGSVVITGMLRSDDDEAISNATITLKQVFVSNSKEKYVTTDTYGRFTATITDISSFNGVFFACTFDGDERYSASTIGIRIPVYQETLELTSNKNILSYADNDYATLSVQYKDEGDMNLGSGKEIDLYQIFEADGLEITSDKDVLSYADNESATITAQIKNGNNNVHIHDEPIKFTIRKKDDEITPIEVSSLHSTITIPGDIIQIHFSNANEGYMYLILKKNETDVMTMSYDAENNNLLINYDEKRTTMYGDTIYIDLKNGLINDFVEIHEDNDENYTLSIQASQAYNGTIEVSSNYCQTYIEDTNAQGNASIVYDSCGIGDIEVTAELVNCSELSKTYELEDCYKSGFHNIVFSQFNSTTNPVTITHQTDNELSFCSGGRASKTPTIINSQDDWEFSYTVLASKVTNGGLGFGLQSDNATGIDNLILRLESREYYSRTVTNLFIASSQYNHTDMSSNPQRFDVKFIKNGTTINAYVDDVLIKTVNNLNWLNDPLHLALTTWGGTSSFYQTITNFKLKKL